MTYLRIIGGTIIFVCGAPIYLMLWVLFFPMPFVGFVWLVGTVTEYLAYSHKRVAPEDMWQSVHAALILIFFAAVLWWRHYTDFLKGKFLTNLKHNVNEFF